MSEEQKSHNQVLDELESLGRQLTTAIKALWESEDSRKLRQDIREGFVELSREIDTAIKSAQESESAKQFRGQVQETVDKARESDATGEIERGLASGLNQLNQELSRLIDSLERSGTRRGPQEPTSPEGGEPDTGGQEV